MARQVVRHGVWRWRRLPPARVWFQFGRCAHVLFFFCKNQRFVIHEWFYLKQMINWWNPEISRRHSELNLYLFLLQWIIFLDISCWLLPELEDRWKNTYFFKTLCVCVFEIHVLYFMIYSESAGAPSLSQGDSLHLTMQAVIGCGEKKGRDLNQCWHRQTVLFYVNRTSEQITWCLWRLVWGSFPAPLTPLLSSSRVPGENVGRAISAHRSQNTQTFVMNDWNKHRCRSLGKCRSRRTAHPTITGVMEGFRVVTRWGLACQITRWPVCH